MSTLFNQSFRYFGFILETRIGYAKSILGNGKCTLIDYVITEDFDDVAHIDFSENQHQSWKLRKRKAKTGRLELSEPFTN